MIVNEEWKGRRGQETDVVTGRHTRVFVVQTGDFNAGSEQVLAAVGIPRIYDTYVDADGQNDTTCFCVDIRPEQDNADPGVWRVYAEYSTDAYGAPTNMPQIVVWSIERFTKAVYVDQDGNAILNSAGDPYDPPVTVDDSRLVVKVVRNELEYPTDVAIAYKDAVNSDSFEALLIGGAPADPGTVKMANVGGELMNSLTGAFRYWRMTYEMHVNNNGWQPKVLDAGFHTGFAGGIIGFNRKLVTDPVSGIPLSQAVPLDGLGNVLAPAGTPVFNVYNVYPSEPFNDLDFTDLAR